MPIKLTAPAVDAPTTDADDTPAPAAPAFVPDATETVTVRVLPLGAGRVAVGGCGIASFHPRGAMLELPRNVAEAQEAAGLVEIQDTSAR